MRRDGGYYMQKKGRKIRVKKSNIMSWCISILIMIIVTGLNCYLIFGIPESNAIAIVSIWIIFMVAILSITIICNFIRRKNK